MRLDKELLKKLYQKYIYSDKQSIKTEWDKVIEEYEEITGVFLNQDVVRKEITTDDRIMLFEEKFGKETPLEEIEKKAEKREPFSYRILVDVRDKQDVDPEDALRLANLNPTRWEIVDMKITNSEIGSKEGMLENYYASIKVRPVDFKWTREAFILAIREIKPYPVLIQPKEDINPHGLLEIPLFDMHFGVNVLSDYERHMQKIANYITSGYWEEIVFVVGQDLFHNDNFKGETSNGTPIEKVNFEQSWQDANDFYRPLIELALANSQNVKVIYSRGNHDRTIGYGFAKMLEAVYEGNNHITFDISDDIMQAHKYHDVLLVYSHGERLKESDITKIVYSRYISMINEDTRVVFKKGHKHTMTSFDDFGTAVFGLGTSAKTDKWHDDNNYVGNHKSFEIFIYDTHDMIGHMFINHY